jgi:hypothetical protein
MFILIFGLILTSQVLRKLWCTKMGAWKIIKEPNEKKTLVFYNISKDRNSKLGNPKNKRATKPN